MNAPTRPTPEMTAFLKSLSRLFDKYGMEAMFDHHPALGIVLAFNSFNYPGETCVIQLPTWEGMTIKEAITSRLILEDPVDDDDETGRDLHLWDVRRMVMIPDNIMRADIKKAIAAREEERLANGESYEAEAEARRLIDQANKGEIEP